MDKRKHTALLAAVGLFLALPGAVPQVYAQYGVQANPTAGVTEQQLAECDDYSIPREECNEHTLLAARRGEIIKQNPNGSGTPMISIGGSETWVYVGVLGAIFGGVAAVFFARGRGAVAP